MGLLFVWSVPLVAAGFAHWDGAYQGRAGFSLLALLVVWGLLHAGTLWLNAALDRDESDVLWGEAVAPPPATRASGCPRDDHCFSTDDMCRNGRNLSWPIVKDV